jgi:hypothetical protein
MTMPYREGSSGRATFTFTPAGRWRAIALFVLCLLLSLTSLRTLLPQIGDSSLSCERIDADNASCQATFDGLISHTRETVPLREITRAQVTTIHGKSLSYHLDVLKIDGSRLSITYGSDLNEAQKALAEVNTVINGRTPQRAGPYLHITPGLFYAVPLIMFLMPFVVAFNVRNQVSRYTFAIDRSMQTISIRQRALGAPFGAKDLPIGGITAFAIETKTVRNRSVETTLYRIVVERSLKREPLTPWLRDPKVAVVARQIAEELHVNMIPVGST